MVSNRALTPQLRGADVPPAMVGVDSPPGSPRNAAWVVARSFGMVALAAFGILLLLPAALAAQAAVAF
jgi:hypothetical protein